MSIPPRASHDETVRAFLVLGLAAAVCVQWIVQRALGGHPPQPWTAVLPGLCILGAAFLLTWAAEAAEMDLPQSVSIGALALVAVLPEYAVDLYFAWKAGKDPVYTAYATANMTGANRLLIGIGWPAVLLAAFWNRSQRSVDLSPANALELMTLLGATLYSFLIPIKGNLNLGDTFILVSLFGFYAYLSSKAEVAEPELEGPALVIAGLPKTQRRILVGGLFVFAAAAIFLSAEPFAEGILEAGRLFEIEEFLLVQWLAPLASEAPEFIVAILFALKGKAEVGMRALISSKVNQWTLLVGMLPAAYSLSAGTWAPMPMDSRQVEEMFLTSAQSLFGMVLLMNLHFTLGEAVSLAVLFLAQMFFPQSSVRYAFAGAYIVLAGVILLTQAKRRESITSLLGKVLEQSRGR